MPAVLYTNLFNFVVVGLATVFVTLYISHKIAGPLYRFETDLKMIAEGDLKHRIRLREGDQLKDLADSLNLFISTLEKRFEGAQQIIEDMLEYAEEREDIDAVKKLKDVQRRLDG